MKNHFFVILLAVVATATITETASAYYSTKLGRFISRDPIGYRGGLNTYEYVNGKPLSNSDPLGLRSLEAQTCTDALAKAFDRMEEYITEMRQEGCSMGFYCSSTSCNSKCEDGRKGYYEDGIMYVCVNNHPTGDLNSMTETWRHEISHRYDDCINADEGIITMDCWTRAATEARASSLGECRDGGTGRKDGKSFENCVKDQVKAALKARFERSCSRLANNEEKMDQVFDDYAIGDGSGDIPSPEPWPFDE